MDAHKGKDGIMLLLWFVTARFGRISRWEKIKEVARKDRLIAPLSGRQQISDQKPKITNKHGRIGPVFWKKLIHRD